MADKRNDTLSESDKQRKVWKRVEKLIAQHKAEDALLLLRELDEKGSHQTTLRLAGMATHKIAQQTNAKSDYRKAASLLQDSVNMNPKEKKSSRAYNDLLNEMQEVKMIMQVHDELVFECPKDNADMVMHKMKDTMEKTVKLNIPLIAEAAIGYNWNEAH